MTGGGSRLPAARPLVIVVDAANVIGARGRGDGWWRDRAGAVRRLRDDLARLAAIGILPDSLPAHLEGYPANPAQPRFVLVVEGAARTVGADRPDPGAADDPGGAGVTVRAAPGSGDDEVVAVVAAATTAAGERAVGRRSAAGTDTAPTSGRPDDEFDPRATVLVVTADRELRDRVAAAGATVAGPRWLLSLLP